MSTNQVNGREEIMDRHNIFYVPVCTGELLVYYAELINGTIFEFFHHHPFYEIYYVTKGSINMRLNNRSFRLKRNHMILIMPGVNHKVDYEPSVDSQFFVITFEFYPRAERDIKSRDVIIDRFEMETLMRTVQVHQYFKCIDKFNCNSIIKKIDMELKNKNLGWNMNVQNLYLQFIINSLRNITLTSPYPPYSRKNVNAAIEISKYMHKHFHESISLKDIAKALGMTPRNVSRLYKGYFGTTVGNALRQFRYNFARYYLITTDHSVDKIAEMVGFSSARTIYKLLKENEGLTVTEFRRRYKRQ